MSDFDPNREPETQGQADAYVHWCAEHFTRLSASGPWTYRTALRCAHWLLVVSVAQLHLEGGVQVSREALLGQLVEYQRLARALERQRDHISAERLIVLRSSLDCWQPAGQFAVLLLSAAKDAVSALVLIELYPLVDLWALDAPDVWALLDAGRELLASINLQPEPEFDDYAIAPDELVIARYTWQRANDVARHAGVRRLSEN